jgi:hypothetical protein
MFSAPPLMAHELPSVLRALDEVPKDEDVVAGWGGLALILLLIAAVVFLSMSLSKRLKNAARAKADGVYGDEPADAADPAGRGDSAAQ